MSGSTNYTFTVNASASFSGNDAPEFDLIVDGKIVGTGTVASYSVIDQSFTVALPPGVAETVSVAFINYNSSSQMLDLQSIGINGQTISTNTAGEQYVSTNGIYNQWSQMYFGGQINIPVAASYFTGLSTSPGGGSGGNSGGSSGTSTGGTTGGSTGGSTGTSTGGSTGSSTGGSTGGSTAGSTGSSAGSSTGGSTGGSTSGSTGSGTGGSTGGSTGTTTAYIIGIQAAASYSGNNAPDITLMVDGQAVGTGTFTSASEQTLTFTADLTPGTSHAVAIVYTNHNSTSEMLNVSGLTVNGQTVSTAEAGEQYVSPQGTYNQWGQMYFGGQINLPVAASYFTAANASTGSGSTATGSTGTGSTGTASTGSSSTGMGSTGMGSTGMGSTGMGSTGMGSTGEGSTGEGSTGEGSSGTGSSSTAGTMPVGTALYISPTGSDSNSGSVNAPFATFSHAIQAMEQDGIHTLYVAGGAYSVGSTISLGSPQDSGDTIQAVSGALPVLQATNGVSTLVSLNNVSNVTISGLTFSGASSSGTAAALNLTGSNGNTITGNSFTNDGEGVLFDQGSSNNSFTGNQLNNSATSAVEVKNGSNANTFSNNTINGTGAIGTAGGGFYVHGSSNDVFSNNLVENTAGVAIGIEDFGYGDTVNQGNTITGNEILNAATSTASTDVGAIYLLDRSDSNMSTTVSMNFVSGVGNVNSAAHAEGIYLDDDTSGVTVTGNIVKGVQSDAVEVHGGSNDTIINNILDLGTSTRTAVLLQQPQSDWPAFRTPALSSDEVTQNIIISQQASPLNVYAYFDPESLPVSIFNNLYWDPNSPGNTIPMTAPAVDTHPVYGNPNIVNPAGNDYSLSTGSAAGQIGFTAISQKMIGLLSH